MKKITFFTAIGIALMIIFSLIGSIYQLWHKQDVLYTTANKLAQIKKEHIDLTNKLRIVHTDQFVEEQARDELFLTKPNEHEVIISDSLDSQKVKVTQKTDSTPYWQQWVHLFF